MVLVILILSFIVAFIMGFWIQLFFEKIEKHREYEMTRASKIIPWLVNIVYWEFKINFLALFSKKEKQYLEEMKKELKVPFLTKEFEENLLKEKNIYHIRKILEIVLQKQEKNRRKKERPKNIFYQNFFFIRQHFMEEGNHKGIRVIDYYYNYILSKKYIVGSPLPIAKAEIAMNIYGTSEEQEAIASEYLIKRQETNFKKNYYEFIDREKFLKRKEKMNLKKV